MTSEGSMRNFTQLLGIELPIIQAPMAGVQNSALTIAVCKAGGLGSLPCGMLSPEAIESELKAIEQATNSSYNLNFFCHEMTEYNPQQHAQWQETLKPYFDEFDAECVNSPGGASRMPFSHEVADVIEPFRPPIVSFHFGLPQASLLERVKSWGSKVISSATTLEEALWLEANGVDAVIVQGLEAGGHRGMFLSDDLSSQLGLYDLLTQVVKQVDVPVIATGGIADSNGVKTALSLGASAVQVGTAYLLCSEATTSELHREALKGQAAQQTALTSLFSGKPARGIVNRVMSELGCFPQGVPNYPYAANEITQLRKLAEVRGSADFSPLWSGQNVSGCEAISAAELTKKLASFS